ncbi:hypothetical protein MMC19_004414 [Ptychographa xylographoides]|nr:hypothetical protein [Ptychographa xylographoides]
MTAHFGPPALVILLVTPTLADLFGGITATIPRLLRNAFMPSPDVMEIDILAAVVDRISYPPEMTLEVAGVDKTEALHGSEGISISISDSAKTSSNLWSGSGSGSEQGYPLKEEQQFLSFRHYAFGVKECDNYDHKPLTAYTVEVALANTIFQTGTPTTSLLQRWVLDWKPSSSPTAHCVKQAVVRRPVLTMPQTAYASKHRIASDVPSGSRILTAPRIVSEALGNIIRTFENESDPNNGFPASEELERVLASAVVEVDQAEEVWARVTPRERWTGLPQPLRRPLEVDHGARLHRVLSGGGGWGSKRGLISLDPESSISNSSEQDTFGDGEDPEAEQKQALGEVVRAGDAVEFIAFTQPSRTPVKAQDAKIVEVSSSTKFGSIGSQKDTMPEDTSQKCGIASQRGPLVIHGHFGALSETGISLNVQLLHNKRECWGAQKLGTVVQTKLPPFSTFTQVVMPYMGNIDPCVRRDSTDH